MLRKLMLPLAAVLALSACATAGPTELCADRWVEGEEGRFVLQKDASCQEAAAEPEVPVFPAPRAGL